MTEDEHCFKDYLRDIKEELALTNSLLARILGELLEKGSPISETINMLDGNDIQPGYIERLRKVNNATPGE